MDSFSVSCAKAMIVSGPTNKVMELVLILAAKDGLISVGSHSNNASNFTVKGSHSTLDLNGKIHINALGIMER